MSRTRPAKLLTTAISLVFLTAPAAQADKLEDYYRTQFMMRLCNTDVEATDNQRENLDLSVEEEVMDINASSEEIGDIFARLQGEYDSNPGRFCNRSEPVAVDVLETMGN